MLRAISTVIASAAIAAAASLTPTGATEPVSAASCVRFSAVLFDAVGTNDNTNLNGEWVRVKNYCTTTATIGGWRIHDYNKIHSYYFPAGFKVAAGVSVTLYTGYGTNTTTKRYWRKGRPVWNNAPPEYAYLRNGAGTLMSKKP